MAKHGPGITLLAALLLCAAPGEARKLLVGAGKAYPKPSAAADAARNGDTVEIDPGTYAGDACTWSADNLVIRATAKYARLDAQGAEAQGKGIWVVDGKNTLIENIEFTGAKVPDENGAGIRLEGQGITIRNCYFHDNENGVFGDGTVILIEGCEFDHNGIGEVGRTHNMYINSATSFTLRYCYTHNSVVGHTVKSRALKNFILYNRIMDEMGSTSYEIDLPWGGESYVIGNLLQKGTNTGNSTFISIGEEGVKNANSQIYVINNTFVDERSPDRQKSGSFVLAESGITPVKVVNNLFVGADHVLSGKGDTLANVVTAHPFFVDSAQYDYRLTAASPALNKGIDPGSANGIPLTPVFEYVNKSGSRPRPVAKPLDAGAYEFNGGASIRPSPGRGSRLNGAAAPVGFRFNGARLVIGFLGEGQKDALSTGSDSQAWIDFLGKSTAAAWSNRPVKAGI